MRNITNMSQEDEVLQVTLEAFPHLTREISSLFVESSIFMEICEDYVICSNSIREMELNNRASELEIHSLKNSLKELEQELISKIKP
jgi:uncharacterized protein YdcH (DUF465 family)